MISHVSSLSSSTYVQSPTKLSKASFRESSEKSSINWDHIPQDVHNIIFDMLSEKNRLDMLCTSKKNSRNTTILPKQHISGIISRYFAMSPDKRPLCSIVKLSLQNTACALELKFDTPGIKNFPSELLDRKNLSIDMRINEDIIIQKLNIKILQKIQKLDGSHSCITSRTLVEWLKKCPELIELDIRYSKDIRNLDLSKIGTTKIQKIDVYRSITSEVLAELLEKCPELINLNISRSKNIQNLDLSNRVSTKIKTIDAGHSFITSQGLAALLEKCPELIELDIRYCENIYDLDLSNIGTTKIQQIKAYRSSITSQGLAAVLEKCPELIELEIRNYRYIHELDFSSICSTKIQKIYAKSYSITSEDITALFEKCPKLSRDCLSI